MSEEQAVETIARAIRGAHGADPEVSIFPSYDWRIEAEAALAALREQGWKSPEEIRAALGDGAPAETAADVLQYWAERNGAFMLSSVKANNRRSAREAWSAALDRALRVLIGDEQAEETP